MLKISMLQLIWLNKTTTILLPRFLSFLWWRNVLFDDFISRFGKWMILARIKLNCSKAKRKILIFLAVDDLLMLLLMVLWLILLPDPLSCSCTLKNLRILRVTSPLLTFLARRERNYWVVNILFHPGTVDHLIQLGG